MFKEEHIIPLDDEDYRLLRDLIRDYSGLYFDDSSKYLLERRLSRRVLNLHLDSFRDYYRYLLYDKRREEELAAIMDVLTVNETYFFREQSQLEAFTEELLPELKARKGSSRRLRIWSAGCSSGEEPYTIAMLILEQGLPMQGWEVEVLGSDINQRVLQAARRGLYRQNSFRSTNEYYIKKYFVQEGDAFRIKDVVRRLVSFSHLNLLDALKARFIGTVDVVFCRNVLIYFDQEARKKVADVFYQRLAEGGYLLLGHAESLMNVSTAFVLKYFKRDIVYQKPRKPPLSVSQDGLVDLLWRQQR